MVFKSISHIFVVYHDVVKLFHLVYKMTCSIMFTRLKVKKNFRNLIRFGEFCHLVNSVFYLFFFVVVLSVRTGVEKD